MPEDSKIEIVETPPLALRQRRAIRRGSFGEPAEARAIGLDEHWKVILKRRWTIFSVLLGVFTVVLLGTMKEKPVYEARGLMEIEQENPGIVTVQQLFQVENSTDDYLATQERILQSDTLAREVIRQLRLDQLAEFNSPGWTWPWRGNHSASASDEAAFPEDAAHEQRVLRSFEERLSVTPVERSRLVRVSFDSEDPQLAANVVNSLASDYIQENLQMRWDATQRASEWLSQQLDGLKIKLEKSEDQLQAYAEANGLLLIANDKGQTENMVEERLRELQQELTQAQADRYEKEAAYRLVEAGDSDSLPGLADNRVIQDLTDRLADLERQRAELAPEFKPDYPKMKQVQSEIDRIGKMIESQRAEAAKQATNDYLAAVRRETLIREAFEKQQKEANAVAEKSVQYGILKREVESNQQLYEGLLQKWKEAGVSAGMKASNIRIVDAAVPPVSPVKPRIALNLMLGLFMGLACGLAVAFAQERMDNTLKSADEAEEFLGVPVLASIPCQKQLGQTKNEDRFATHAVLLEAVQNSSATKDRAEKENPQGWQSIRLDVRSYEKSAVSEAYRSLRTSVLLSSAGRPPRSLAFVSAEPQEGKTTICCNLAILLAQLNKRVLVVDGDLRQPAVHEFFRASGEAGLVNYLTGDEDWRGLAQQTMLKNLDFLACGPEPPNPSELLSSERMTNLMREAMADYNFVLVDSPPLLRVTDGRILTTVVEGTILVVRGEKTSRELVRQAQTQISGVGGHLVGVVLNEMQAGRVRYYSAGKLEMHKKRNGIQLGRSCVSDSPVCRT